MSVEIEGAQIVDALRGKQVRLLLAYLILNRARQVGREELSAALWPFSAPRSQDGALRTLLSRLRSAVGASVLSGRDQLTLLLPEPVWIDLEAARTEVARALAALEQGEPRAAWALAQVPLNVASRGLLPGTEAVWLEPVRRELEELRLQSLELIGRAGLGLGGSQLASAERAARALIESEPYRESAYVLLMEALAAQGNIAEGVRAFDKLRSLLRDELGTLPSPEALAAHEALLNPQPRAPAAAEAPAQGNGGVPVPPELASRAQALLVGRADELAELDRLWALASAGHGAAVADAAAARVAVLAGDPGVGKTRLVAELACQVHDRGAVVLAGRAPEETLVPYQPFLEALRHYVVNASLDELRTTAREYGSELARLVPDLRRRVPDLVSELPDEPETERYRMFEAVVGLLSAISRRAPILLVLDDLHWADRPTLLLLRHLARAGDPRRLLILAAYRGVETEESLGGALADLHRAQLLHQIPVGGLTEPETAELVRLRTGEIPSTAFVAALQAETEGNPLFIEEILSHLREAGVRPSHAGSRELQSVGLPEGVKQVIARRLARLEAPAVEWLRVAAVIGRDFDLALLERVLGRPEPEFLDALDHVLATGLASEAGEPGRYSFAHALIRETLYEGMSAPRRARLHHRVGVALEAAGDAELGALALHFARAGAAEDAEKAITYACEAGEQAAGLSAHEEAADHFARALEVQGRFFAGDESRRYKLLLLFGEALVRAGDPTLAWPALSEAAALADRHGDGAAVARAAIAASRRYLQQPGVVDEPLIALLERALELTHGQRTTVRVMLLARMCGALYFSTERARMPALSEEATEIASELEDPEALVYACAARRRALWEPARLEDRLAASTQMLLLAQQSGNLEQQLQAHAWLVVDLLEQGDTSAVEAQMLAFSGGAGRLRQPLFVWHATVWRAMRAMLAGELAEAESLAGEALAAGSSAESVAAAQYYAAQMLTIRREQCRMAELEQPARQFVAANSARPAWRAALAELLIHSGRREEAADMFAALAAAGFRDIPQDGDWMTAATLLSDVACGLGDAQRARLLHAALEPYRSQNVVIGLGAACLGSVRRYLGRLAATIGRKAEAAEHFEHALSANARLGAVVELAHTQLDYVALLDPGDRRQRLVEAAAATARAHDLPRVSARLSELSGG